MFVDGIGQAVIIQFNNPTHFEMRKENCHQVAHHGKLILSNIGN